MSENKFIKGSMNKKIILVSVVIAILSITLFISSCAKKQPVDSNTEAAKDHVLSELHTDDIVNIGMEASYGSMVTYRLSNSGNSIYSTPCATITVNNSIPADNDTMTVNFSSNCTGQDGRVRSGSIQYIYTGGFHYLDSSNVINVSTSNYIVDGNTIKINNETIKNMGHVTNGNLTYSITANINMTKSGGGNVQCTRTETKVLLAGEQPNNLPIDWAHAQIAVYGTATGTSSDGESFTASITQANWLVRNFNCTSYRKYFVAGELDFIPGSKPTRYINYGTGTCDNQAIITISGNLYTITLP